MEDFLKNHKKIQFAFCVGLGQEQLLNWPERVYQQFQEARNKFVGIPVILLLVFVNQK